MKFELNTETKLIKVEGNVSLKELYSNLKKLLPKDSPFGSWEEYTLEANTVITWVNPIPYRPYWYNTPYYGTYTSMGATSSNINYRDLGGNLMYKEDESSNFGTLEHKPIQTVFCLEVN